MNQTATEYRLWHFYFMTNPGFLKEWFSEHLVHCGNLKSLQEKEFNILNKYIIRDNYTWEYQYKMIIRPEWVWGLGPHKVLKFHPKGVPNRVKIPDNIAILHHYRFAKFNKESGAWFEYLPRPITEDCFIHKWMTPLSKAVRHTLGQIGEDVKLIYP